MELKNIYGDVIFALESAKTVLELVTAARAAKADLSYSDLRGSDLSALDPWTVNLARAIVDWQQAVTIATNLGLDVRAEG